MSKTESALEGTWQGSLDIGNGMNLPLLFKFSAGTDGKLKAAILSPAQSQTWSDCDQPTLSGNQLVVPIGALKAKYEGEFDALGSSIVGTFSQAGTKFPLKCARVAEYKPPRHSQEPLPPFPYEVKEVNFKSGDHQIDGTLTLPSGTEKVAAAILVCGSGPHDRDEQIFFHKPLMVIADYLTRQGIAVLRYDKRGVGKSTGTYSSATTLDFAEDAIAAFKYLQSNPRIKQGEIGIIGHSEGGVVAPIVASKNAELAFIVSLAGSALSGDKILLGQVGVLSNADDAASKAEQKKILEQARRSYEIVKTEQDNQKALEKLKQLRKELPLAGEEPAKDLASSSDSTAKQGEIENAKLSAILSPWYRFFISYDPATAWSKVKCPVLALNGDKDVQVVADENLASIRNALSHTGNTHVTIIKVDGVNHLFQHCKTGLPSEYASIDETFSPAVLETMSKWIKALFVQR